MGGVEGQAGEACACVARVRSFQRGKGAAGRDIRLPYGWRGLRLAAPRPTHRVIVDVHRLLRKDPPELGQDLLLLLLASQALGGGEGVPVELLDEPCRRGGRGRGGVGRGEIEVGRWGGWGLGVGGWLATCRDATGLCTLLSASIWTHKAAPVPCHPTRRDCWRM